VRTGPKVAALAAAVDEAAWESALAEFDVLERFDFDYGIDLEARPVRETIASGTVVGVKGRLVALANGGTTYAVDMRDLVGYDLAEARRIAIYNRRWDRSGRDHVRAGVLIRDMATLFPAAPESVGMTDENDSPDGEDAGENSEEKSFPRASRGDPRKRAERATARERLLRARSAAVAVQVAPAVWAAATRSPR